jgi:hypothetical protein
VWKAGRNEKETYGYDSNESLASKSERMVTLVSEYYCTKGFVSYEKFEAVVHLVRQKLRNDQAPSTEFKRSALCFSE